MPDSPFVDAMPTMGAHFGSVSFDTAQALQASLTPFVMSKNDFTFVSSRFFEMVSISAAVHAPLLGVGQCQPTALSRSADETFASTGHAPPSAPPPSPPVFADAATLMLP